jgi:hypothetical protein
VTTAQQNFGQRLRNHRERGLITLVEIAETTKIKRSLLEQLERGDVSVWPGGLFRRAFVRAYATAIGLSPESLVEEFAQVFPESAVVESAVESGQELRLTLAIDPWRGIVATVTDVVVAVLEAGAIVAVASLTASMTARSASFICAVIALTYYSASAAWLGRSPGSWCRQHGLRVVWQRRATRRSPSVTARELIYLVHRREYSDTDTQEDAANTNASPPAQAASR